jgi:hypothetical protein
MWWFFAGTALLLAGWWVGHDPAGAKQLLADARTAAGKLIAKVWGQ